MILQILIIQNIQTYFLKNIIFIFELLANKLSKQSDVLFTANSSLDLKSILL